MVLRYHLLGILVAQFIQGEIAQVGNTPGFFQQGRWIELLQPVQRPQVPLAVAGASAAQLVDAGVVAQGGEYIVQGFAGGSMHLDVAAGHHRQVDVTGQAMQGGVAGDLVVAQQVADAQPYPAFAQALQLQPPGAGRRIIALRQPDQQAAFQVEDHIPQGCPVLALGAASPGHADQARQFAVGGPARRQCHQPDTFLQVELAADNQFDTQFLRRHVGFHHTCQRALVGHGQCGVAQGRGPLHQFMGMGGAAQEAVATETMEFGVAQHRLYIYTVCPDGSNTRTGWAGRAAERCSRLLYGDWLR